MFRCAILTFSPARNFLYETKIMRKKKTKLLVVSLVLSTLGISTTQLVANANVSHTYWKNANTGFLAASAVELEQVITPLESGGNQKHYWATQWFFEGRAAVSDGAYMGVQTEGSRWDTASYGPIAIFSIWGATSATPGPGAVCRRFDWEGIGMQCRLDLNTVMTGNKMTVKRSEDGLSWTAQIEQTNELPKTIATISIEAKLSIKSVVSFQEYWGPNSTTLCSELPGAAAKFTFPKYVFENGATSQGIIDFYFKNPCISVDQKEFNPGLEVFMRQGQSQTPIPETIFELKEAAEAKAKAEAEVAAKAKEDAENAAKQQLLKKKKVVTCVRGANQKKVVGVNAKCPVGYKKK